MGIKDARVVECFDKIKAFFNGDMDKTYAWFETKNPALGFISPLDMIKSGRQMKLLKFIDNQVQGNWP